MKHEWADLEAALLANKTGPTRLGFAVLLKFFQYAARFPLGHGGDGGDFETHPQ